VAEQGPDPTRLLALRYEPSEFEVRRSRAVRTFVVLFLLVGAAAAVWGLSLYLLSHSWSSGSTLALVLLAIIVVTVSGLARLFMVERLPRIVDGVMRLPFPMRTPTGRIREVRLSSIQRVTPEARPGEPFGVWVDMKDGSRFYISWTLLGNGGTRALEGLCRAFGTSFEGAFKRVCFGGSRWKFQVAHPARLEGTALRLAKTIRTSTRSSYLLGNEVRKIDPAIVDEVEPVSPSYAGPAYLVTMSDGSFFLILGTDAARVRLFDNPSWRAKLRDRPGDWLAQGGLG